MVRLDGETRVYFILGDPIAQVKAPSRMTDGFASRGANAVLVPMHVAASDLDAFIAGAARSRNLDGIILTIPHKVAGLRHCATATDRARLAGAVNVLRRDDAGCWFGDTTDGEAFVAGIRRAGCEPRGLRALVVGAGGTGSAIAVALLGAGVAELAVHSRSAGPRDRLVEALARSHPGRVRAGCADPASFDLVVNATPAGMAAGDPLPVPPEKMGPGIFVGDVVTGPDVTPLVAAARARGCRTSTGIDMVGAAIGLMLDFFLETKSARR